VPTWLCNFFIKGYKLLRKWLRVVINVSSQTEKKDYKKDYCLITRTFFETNQTLINLLMFRCKNPQINYYSLTLSNFSLTLNWAIILININQHLKHHCERLILCESLCSYSICLDLSICELCSYTRIRILPRFHVCEVFNCEKTRTFANRYL
jgi:hypothetical protein